MKRNNQVDIFTEIRQSSNGKRIPTPPRSDDVSWLLTTNDSINISQSSLESYYKNENCTILKNIKNIVNGGYIFPMLPAPYAYIGHTGDIELVIPQLLTDYTPIINVPIIKTYKPLSSVKPLSVPRSIPQLVPQLVPQIIVVRTPSTINPPGPVIKVNPPGPIIIPRKSAIRLPG